MIENMTLPIITYSDTTWMPQKKATNEMNPMLSRGHQRTLVILRQL